MLKFELQFGNWLSGIENKIMIGVYFNERDKFTCCTI